MSSCGGSNKHYRESEKAIKRELGIFFFRFRQSTPSSGSAAAAVSERAPEAGAPRGTPSRGRRARSLASVSAQHPQLLQVAPVSQRPRVVSVEAVDLVVEGRERLLLDGLQRSRARCAKAALRSLPSSSTSRLQLSKLMMEKAYYLHMRRLFRGCSSRTPTP